MPEADRALWERLRNPDELERFLDDPDFSSLAANILIVGTVPDRAV